ncbi:MAG: FAD-binding oxidoreductase [Betaproteobacteria bacterium]|nr:FAD-binding oxidoreductase [Betaproteobacteria bacterium]
MNPASSVSDPLIRHLAEILGPGGLFTDAQILAPRLVDWRGRYQGRARCLALPKTAEEVSAVVRACAGAGAPVVPQGGNTGLCGGATPDESGAAVLVGLTRMNRVRSLDARNNTMTAEAGCVLATVQEAALAARRLFPLSLAAEGSATLGGNLSTNAGGIQVLRYGNTRELTLGLEVVLPSGEIWNGLRALRKDNTGYDLKHLFIGAEGTLGIITAATMRLFPLPAAMTTAWIAVPDADAAVALLNLLQERFGAMLTACELVSEAALELVLHHFPESIRPLPEKTPWYLLCELSGSDSRLDEAFEEFLATALETCALRDAILARSLDQAERLWHLRENLSEAQQREGVSIKHDIALPISRIPEFLARAQALLEEHFPGVRIIAFGHIGDGNLHYNLSLPDREANTALLKAQPRVHCLVHDLVAALDGSISAEHGLGQLKRAEILRYKTPVEMELMRAIKKTLDPLNLMNPGKVL